MVLPSTSLVAVTTMLGRVARLCVVLPRLMMLLCWFTSYILNPMPADGKLWREGIAEQISEEVKEYTTTELSDTLNTGCSYVNSEHTHTELGIALQFSYFPAEYKSRDI